MEFKNLFCKNCNFTCHRESDWKRHINTSKHKKKDFHLINKCKSSIIINKTEYSCDNCCKKYKHRNSLWYHLKKCKQISDDTNSENIECFEINNNNQIVESYDDEKLDFKSLIFELISQNKELQNQIMELSKNTIINSNNNINNNNKTFNIQMFLNEKCKDALTMNQFIESLKITMDDVERFGTDGFIEGITKIFIKNLKMLDISKRPVHCSDLKREIIYVKEDDNTWQKDDENKETMKKTINKIAYKNFLRIQDWREENPEYKDPESKVNDKYQKIMFEAMGGYTKEENEKNFAKIIRNVSKQITIDKTL